MVYLSNTVSFLLDYHLVGVSLFVLYVLVTGLTSRPQRVEQMRCLRQPEKGVAALSTNSHQVSGGSLFGRESDCESCTVSEDMTMHHSIRLSAYNWTSRAAETSG